MNQCSACDPLCDGCTNSGNAACQACATNKYPVENTSLKCVTACADHASNFYLDAASSTCKECDALCATCTGAGNELCSSCAASKYPVESTTICVSDCTDHAANFFLDASTSTCKQCDPFCASCNGPGSNACTSCAAGKYIVSGTSICVTACSDHAANYYLDSTTCKLCNGECATCSGPLDYNCDTCVNKEILDSPTKSPKHCTSSCGDGLYVDGADCRGKF